MKRRFIGFSVVPLLSSLGPLLLLPLVARVASAEEWAAIGSGQALGALVAVCVGLGWTLVGPARIARASRTSKSGLWWDSLSTRGFALVASVPIMAVCTALFAFDDSWALAFFAALSVAVTGLSCAWHAIGVAAPRFLVYFDAAPKVFALLASAGALAFTANLFLYLALMTAAALVSPIGYSLVVRSRRPRRSFRIRRVWRLVRVQAHALGANVLASVHSTAPILIAGLLAPSAAVAALISADKIYRAGLIVTQTAANSTHSWVLEGRPQRLTRRVLVVVGFQSGLGLLGFVGLALLGPWVTAVAFGPELAATQDACVAYGLAYLVLCINLGVRTAMIVPWLGARAALLTSIAAVITGVPLMVILCVTGGAAGCAVGLAFGEAASLTVGIFLLARRRSSR